jgi:hypothetical protein
MSHFTRPALGARSARPIATREFFDSQQGMVCVEQGAATAALQAECNSDEHLTHPPAGSEAPSYRLAGLTILELFGFSALWREWNVGWRDGTSIDLATRRLAGPP